MDGGTIGVVGKPIKSRVFDLVSIFFGVRFLPVFRSSNSNTIFWNAQFRIKFFNHSAHLSCYNTIHTVLFISQIHPSIHIESKALCINGTVTLKIIFLRPKLTLYQSPFNYQN